MWWDTWLRMPCGRAVDRPLRSWYRALSRILTRLQCGIGPKQSSLHTTAKPVMETESEPIRVLGGRSHGFAWIWSCRRTALFYHISHREAGPTKIRTNVPLKVSRVQHEVESLFCQSVHAPYGQRWSSKLIFVSERPIYARSSID
jgi:hypothetical protein